MKDRKQLDPRKPIPNSEYDKLRKNLSSNFREGFPINVEGKNFGGFPGPDTRPSINRQDQITRKDDKVKDFSIGLQDHDEAIMYYFNNVIKPSVIINGDRVNVPVIYGSPERWKSTQKDGYYRDREGEIQVPLIMFKRDSVEKRRDLGNHLDGNNPQLFYTFQEQYTSKNRYDNFSVLQGRKPQREQFKVVVPDFIRIQYTCTIWTDFVAQNNKLIEMINYTSDAYWGDPERFKFNAKIDTYDNITELNQGENRIVRTNFGLNLQGYLIPDSLNKKLSSQNMVKSYTRSQVVFGAEFISTDNAAERSREVARAAQGISIAPIDGGIGFQVIDNNNLIG